MFIFLDTLRIGYFVMIASVLSFAFGVYIEDEHIANMAMMFFFGGSIFGYIGKLERIVYAVYKEPLKQKVNIVKNSKSFTSYVYIARTTGYVSAPDDKDDLIFWYSTEEEKNDDRILCAPKHYLREDPNSKVFSLSMLGRCYTFTQAQTISQLTT